VSLNLSVEKGDARVRILVVAAVSVFVVTAAARAATGLASTLTGEIALSRAGSFQR